MSSPDAKLRSIILSGVELNNAPLEQALRYLTEQSRLADPDKVGVTITFKRFNLNELPPRVTLHFQQATVMQALEEVCRQSRCNYLVGKDAITVLPESLFKSTGPPRRYYMP